MLVETDVFVAPVGTKSVLTAPELNRGASLEPEQADKSAKSDALINILFMDILISYFKGFGNMRCGKEMTQGGRNLGLTYSNICIYEYSYMDNRIQLEQAARVSGCLKAIAHEIRLLIIMTLAIREMGVGELSEALGVAQPTISQHLAKMRERGILNARREGNQIFYSLADERIKDFMGLLKDIFCEKEAGKI